MERCKWCNLKNPLYIKYLAQYQKHIFWSDGNKATGKYIGIVLQIDGMNYFAPLSSFKPKHTKMKELVDFIKIRNIAVINVNNMVPVPNDFKQLEKKCKEY